MPPAHHVAEMPSESQLICTTVPIQEWGGGCHLHNCVCFSLSRFALASPKAGLYHIGSYAHTKPAAMLKGPVQVHI